MKLRGKGKKKNDGDEAPRPEESGPENAGPEEAAAAEEAREAEGGADVDVDAEADADAEAEPEGESAEALRDKWLRAVAEADNARKRARADLDEARRYGTSALLLELLPVLDNLQRALAAPPEGLDEQFLQGLTLIAQQWTTALAAHGVQPLPAEPGTPFDPAVHRALLEQETEEYEPGVIVSEIPGTTRDSVDVLFEKDGKSFVVIDSLKLVVLTLTSRAVVPPTWPKPFVKALRMLHKPLSALV